MKVLPDMVQGFVSSILSQGFDGAVGSPTFHREVWELCCSDQRYVAIAAPRGHAKSSAVTLGYGLSTLLFRERKFMLLVSDTESQSALFLGTFKQALQDNKDLIELFDLKLNEKGLVQFIKDSETDIIVEMNDGHKFRIIAKGAEQKLRGLIWNGSRPDIIMCHEENTDIYTTETGWIKNQDHPSARRVKAHEAYRITFEDGSTEIVSGDHRYFIEGCGWQFPWEITKNSHVKESGSDDIWNAILNEEKQHYRNITINQRLSNFVKNGLRGIWISTILASANTTSPTKKCMMQKLRHMLEVMLPGKLLTVPKDVHVNSTPCLLGCPKNS